MNQQEKAKAFRALHHKGSPLVLYNIWDAGSALALAQSGSAAIATGSWAVAAAQGYEDGENIPKEFALQIVGRIIECVDLPVSVDFEAGYADTPTQLAANVARLIELGAVGLNFEDGRIKGEGLRDIQDQVLRLESIRNAARHAGVPVFINARTDLFLESPAERHPELIAAALERQEAYARAGADGFFVPGLVDSKLVERLVAKSNLPLNVMMRKELGRIEDLAALGVARVSFGPTPYVDSISDLLERFARIG